ncbi:DUF3800 domain-containing protein [Pseudomonas mandelii]|uniref:DUF3800 domain-containing protein n=1 Tax=Pseudomonas mandelii TaxID=75612 RepID=UPI0020A2131C|nr:DUF3800 domain-containing protein [Pseudomonas mandelii]MCO8312548.1 DUF3800 domain-containing protein [Pseudomonas mandelii]
MHIFIDESGSFTFTPKPHAWSTICAVVILDEAMEAAENALKDFKAENGVAPTDELKLGKGVDEMSYFRLLVRFERLNCTLYGLATNAHLNTPEAVSDHKSSSADALVKYIDKMVHQCAREGIKSVSDQVRRLSNQLYIQFTCQIMLMHSVVSQAVNYYAQYSPESLAAFVWRVDQKEPSRKTKYEEVFENLSPGYLQTMSLDDPMPRVQGFDYSHMVRYDVPEGEQPTYLKDDYNIEVNLDDVLDIQKLIREDIQFVNSKDDFGVQLADLLAGGLKRCLRREFKDNLRAAAFLGRLMINRGRGKHPVLLLTLGQEDVLDQSTVKLINMMKRQQRRMIKK